MLNFILYFLIAFSLVGLGIIIFRKIPILANLSEEEMIILARKKGIIQKMREINYKQYWFNLMVYLEKFLRRIKIVFLKIENLLGRWINWLRGRSQIMSQKSREWIKQRDIKKQKMEESLLNKTKDGISIKINKEEVENKIEQEEDDLSISELKKPIKEEQKWINLIIEDPKNITAYKFLGLLYWKQHNYLDAKNSLEMAVKLGSKDKKVKEILKELERVNIK
ncbi:MAG: hypothetical protein HQ537_02250 [Parcubacteria group bacterium]|nr:hypothetical protein [Parcubacteria group bacterium]